MAGAGGVANAGAPSAALVAAASHIPEGPLVVALSGGADSAVAAWLATRHARPGWVRAVFVDHGWESSETMRGAAAAVASTLGVPLEIVAVSPSSTEGAARELRLAALEEEARGVPILTGHHAGDVAETVVGNLMRGAGATGLSGISGSRPPYVRPLVDVPRTDVRSAAIALGLPFVDDPANDDAAHRRNRIRHHVLPALEEAEPGIHAALLRTARLLAADDEVLEAEARRVPLRRDDGAVLVPLGSLTTLSRPVASRVARRALRMARPPYPGDAADVDAILGLRSAATAQLGRGLLAVCEGPYVAVYHPDDLPPPRPGALLAVPGSVDLDPVSISARMVDTPRVRPLGRSTAWLASDMGDIEVRPAEPGERVDIGGGHKLVRDAMAEGGVPARLRPGWPVLTVRGKIAWIVGVRAAAWARAEPSAAQVVEARATRRYGRDGREG